MATYLAFFAAGDFEIERGTTGGLPWVNAVSQRSSDDRPARLDARPADQRARW